MTNGGWSRTRSGGGEPRVRAVAWHAALVVISGLLLVPLASMLVGSLRLPGLPPPRGIEWLPRPLAWGNYAQVFQVVELGRYALNTLVVEALGRLATVNRAGEPHVVPVAFRYNPDQDSIDIGGFRIAQTRKYRDVARASAVHVKVDAPVHVLDEWIPPLHQSAHERGRLAEVAALLCVTQ